MFVSARASDCSTRSHELKLDQVNVCCPHLICSSHLEITICVSYVNQIFTFLWSCLSCECVFAYGHTRVFSLPFLI